MGSRLLAEIAWIAIRKPHVTLRSTPKAFRFYQNLGFEITEPFEDRGDHGNSLSDGYEFMCVDAEDIIGDEGLNFDDKMMMIDLLN